MLYTLCSNLNKKCHLFTMFLIENSCEYHMLIPLFLFQNIEMPKSKKHRGKDLSISIRGQILGMREGGMGYGSIAKKLNLSKWTVVKTVQRFDSRTNFTSKKSSGRPSKASSKDLKRLDSYIKRHKDTTPKEIVANISFPVKERQVYNLRKKLGYIPDSGKKIPKLNEIQKEARIKWCTKMKQKQMDNGIWADEKPFEFGKVRRKSYRKVSEPRIVRPTSKHPKKISIYAAISRKGKTKITLWEGRQKSKDYCDTLKKTLIPFIEKHHKGTYHYYHDKDSTHTSKHTKEWLKNHKIKHEYLPTNSPDLNPIEYLWWRLDARVQKHKPQTFQAYKKRVFEEWNKISMKEVNDVIDHVSHLLPQIKEAEGAIVSSPKKVIKQ